MDRFCKVLNPIADILSKKNADYGDSYYKLRDEYGHLAYHIRIMDKINRVKSLYEKDAQINDESLIDSLKDIIGYTTLEIIYLEGKK